MEYNLEFDVFLGFQGGLHDTYHRAPLVHDMFDSFCV